MGFLKKRTQRSPALLPPPAPPAAPPKPVSPSPDERHALEQQENSAEALCRLGDIYREGLGVGADDRKAMAYYEKAALQNSAEAQYQLGVYYIVGKSVKQNMDTANAYFHLAADQNHAKALSILALDYSLNGYGKEAFTYYDRAARLGIVKAQLALGDLFHSGYRGFVAPDNQKSIYWYCRAYLAGSSKAAEQLNHLISTPSEFRGGLPRIQEMLQGVQSGAFLPPEIVFLQKKQKKRREKSTI